MVHLNAHTGVPDLYSGGHTVISVFLIPDLVSGEIVGQISVSILCNIVFCYIRPHQIKTTALHLTETKSNGTNNKSMIWTMDKLSALGFIFVPQNRYIEPLFPQRLLIHDKDGSNYLHGSNTILLIVMFPSACRGMVYVNVTYFLIRTSPLIHEGPSCCVAIRWSGYPQCSPESTLTTWPHVHANHPLRPLAAHIHLDWRENLPCRQTPSANQGNWSSDTIAVHCSPERLFLGETTDQIK